MSEYWQKLFWAQSWTWTGPFLRDLYEWNKGIISLVAIWLHILMLRESFQKG